MKPKNISDLPQSAQYFLIFRKVGEFMTCEFYETRADVEKAIFDLEYEKEKYKVIKATNLNVELKLSLTENAVVRAASGI